MQTTIDIDPELLRKAEALAERTQRTLSGIIEDWIRREIDLGARSSRVLPRTDVNYDSDAELLQAKHGRGRQASAADTLPVVDGGGIPGDPTVIRTWKLIEHLEGPLAAP